MTFERKKILIVGLGRTGLALARFFQKRGGVVTVTDMSAGERLRENIQVLQQMGIRQELGRHRAETFESSDLIVISPGVPHSIEPITRAKARGVPVMGEVELAARFIEEPIIAVTGTNGKTTTTALIGEIFKTAGVHVFVGGNIGNPLIDYLGWEPKAKFVVVEISSFQLDTIDTFRPRVAVLLNITADHLDRYPDFNAYIASKGRIFANQHENDAAVLNGSDPVVASLLPSIHSRKSFFYHRDPPEGGTQPSASIKPDHIAVRNGQNRENRIDTAHSALMGEHNRENLAAACLATTICGISPKIIETAVKNFKGLPHRLERVAIKNRVTYINDSKATNVDSVARALESFKHPVILIMGGQDKGGDFSRLEGLVRRHAKKLILMGEAKNEIQATLGHVTTTENAGTLEEAVSLAAAGASPGDVVLLSPGCASFDLFSSYAERGEVFRGLVERIP